jgi:hypothetical protein
LPIRREAGEDRPESSFRTYRFSLIEYHELLGSNGEIRTEANRGHFLSDCRWW